MVDKHAPLEDVMAAMDVVDTLRHQQGIAERELNSESRREQLLERLQKLYQAQGIEVPEHVLNEGIEALEQERFQYKPVARSWRTRLASIWVSRGSWGKPVGFLAILAVVFYGVYFVVDVLPKKRLHAAIPQTLERALTQIEQSAKNPELLVDAQQNAQIAQLALQDNDYQRANNIADSLSLTAKLIASEYTVRVVSRPNEQSGIWRVPPNNPQGRNYYLLVEALDSNNKTVELEIFNQEDNKYERVKVWGLRVTEQVFFQIAADKKDDGIIQNNVVGKKEFGFLQPKFSIPTSGSTITRW